MRDSSGLIFPWKLVNLRPLTRRSITQTVSVVDELVSYIAKKNNSTYPAQSKKPRLVSQRFYVTYFAPRGSLKLGRRLVNVSYKIL